MQPRRAIAPPQACLRRSTKTFALGRLFRAGNVWLVPSSSSDHLGRPTYSYATHALEFSNSSLPAKLTAYSPRFAKGHDPSLSTMRLPCRAASILSTCAISGRYVTGNQLLITPSSRSTNLASISRKCFDHAVSCSLCPSSVRGTLSCSSFLRSLASPTCQPL